jgi:AcrR family transcriptional regulator
MPRMPEGYQEKRRDEILDACEELYRRSSFRDVTIKDIAAYTSISRPSIYNYFETIEEIFLGLLQREYARWTEDLKKILDNQALTKEELADAIARTLEPRRTLLRIQATNLYEIEDNSRLGRLTDFKRTFHESMKVIDAILQKFAPEMDSGDRTHFLYTFFPFLYGTFPYSEQTEKQCRAMDAAGMPHHETSVYDLVYQCLIKLLG